MPETITTAAANMAAAFYEDDFARGFILGARTTIQELARRGLLPEKEQEAKEQ